MKIVITKEMMLAARDYVPLAEKEAWATENAPKCFDKLAITADGEPVPPMYAVNTALKSRCMMAALMWLYFGVERSEEDAWLASEEEYDLWAGSHVMNQIERWKHDAELKYKAYDLLADYKDLEKRFSTQLSGLMAIQNDSVIRQNELSAAQLKELPALLEELKKMQGENADGAE